MAAPWSGWERVFVGSVTLVGLALRLVGYTVAPDRHDTPDEVQFAWAGISVLRRQPPTSWSYLPEYHAPLWLVTPDGIGWPLVTPWFDHPPLFGLLVGGAALLSGATSLASVTTAAIRLPSILLAVACIPLAFVLARRVGGRVPAVLGTALFATAPVAVLFGRSVEPEALLAPLLLVALIAVHRLMTGEGGRGTLAVLALACVLAPLAKVPGVAVGGACGVILFMGGRPKAALVAVGGAALGLAAFGAYGAAYDWNLFVGVFGEQAAHRTGVSGAIDFIADPAGLNRRAHDGWWLLGWMAVGLLLVRDRLSPAQALLAWPAVAYAAAMLVMTDERVTTFGWYRIAVYPVLYLAAGWLAQALLRRRPSPVATIAVLITGGTSVGVAPLPGAIAPTVAAALMAIVIGLLALASWRPESARLQTIGRLTARGALGLVLVGNVAGSLGLESGYLRL